MLAAIDQPLACLVFRDDTLPTPTFISHPGAHHHLFHHPVSPTAAAPRASLKAVQHHGRRQRFLKQRRGAKWCCFFRFRRSSIVLECHRHRLPYRRLWTKRLDWIRWWWRRRRQRLAHRRCSCSCRCCVGGKHLWHISNKANDVSEQAHQAAQAPDTRAASSATGCDSSGAVLLPTARRPGRVDDDE